MQYGQPRKYPWDKLPDSELAGVDGFEEFINRGKVKEHWRLSDEVVLQALNEQAGPENTWKSAKSNAQGEWNQKTIDFLKISKQEFERHGTSYLTDGLGSTFRCFAKMENARAAQEFAYGYSQLLFHWLQRGHTGGDESLKLDPMSDVPDDLAKLTGDNSLAVKKAFFEAVPENIQTSIGQIVPSNVVTDYVKPLAVLGTNILAELPPDDPDRDKIAAKTRNVQDIVDEIWESSQPVTFELERVIAEREALARRQEAEQAMKGSASASQPRAMVEDVGTSRFENRKAAGERSASRHQESSQTHAPKKHALRPSGASITSQQAPRSREEASNLPQPNTSRTTRSDIPKDEIPEIARERITTNPLGRQKQTRAEYASAHPRGSNTNTTSRPAVSVSSVAGASRPDPLQDVNPSSQETYRRQRRATAQLSPPEEGGIYTHLTVGGGWFVAADDHVNGRPPKDFSRRNENYVAPAAMRRYRESDFRENPNYRSGWMVLPVTRDRTGEINRSSSTREPWLPSATSQYKPQQREEPAQAEGSGAHSGTAEDKRIRAQAPDSQALLAAFGEAVATQHRNYLMWRDSSNPLDEERLEKLLDRSQKRSAGRYESLPEDLKDQARKKVGTRAEALEAIFAAVDVCDQHRTLGNQGALGLALVVASDYGIQFQNDQRLARAFAPADERRASSSAVPQQPLFASASRAAHDGTETGNIASDGKSASAARPSGHAVSVQGTRNDESPSIASKRPYYLEVNEENGRWEKWDSQKGEDKPLDCDALKCSRVKNRKDGFYGLLNARLTNQGEWVKKTGYLALRKDSLDPAGRDAMDAAVRDKVGVAIDLDSGAIRLRSRVPEQQQHQQTRSSRDAHVLDRRERAQQQYGNRLQTQENLQNKDRRNIDRLSRRVTDTRKEPGCASGLLDVLKRAGKVLAKEIGILEELRQLKGR